MPITLHLFQEKDFLPVRRRSVVHPDVGQDVGFVEVGRIKVTDDVLFVFSPFYNWPRLGLGFFPCFGVQNKTVASRWFTDHPFAILVFLND